MSASESMQSQDFSPEVQARRAKNAAAKAQQQAEYEAATTARNCLGCGTEFRSEGAHHRMCNRCRSRR